MLLLEESELMIDIDVLSFPMQITLPSQFILHLSCSLWLITGCASLLWRNWTFTLKVHSKRMSYLLESWHSRRILLQPAPLSPSQSRCCWCCCCWCWCRATRWLLGAPLQPQPRHRSWWLAVRAHGAAAVARSRHTGRSFRPSHSFTICSNKQNTNMMRLFWRLGKKIDG